ncbi:hypothetical protein K458DRAFT_434448 [Lentithecium fluviatile CBS 122367]|uniref:Vacuolar import and degradation protein-domain-containing protein n=1 Tax=Lentithecium fluviatile CBS 122367 TaxID=1168545 RepID=A0A6G1IR53_9PLEO|nr:hypothetical protein K458DRAFT_434448 [Lentithecium fluviatile CBS 122367]
MPERSPSPSADSGHRAQTPQSYISALSEALESPVNQDVYNLAATLTTPAEDDPDADDSSLQHLRAAQEHDHWRLERSRDQLRALEREHLENRDRSDRLRRVMNRLGRLHDDPRAAYGDRVPSSNNLYDWSPANEADDEDELDQILAELRREQPNTHPEILRVLGRSQLDSERERSRAVVSRLLNSNQPSQPADSSLRSAAILQSVRRHPRFSARTRDYIQRYNADRDSASRSPHTADWRERFAERYGTSPSEASRQAAAMQRIAERRTSLDQAREQARDRDMLARVDSYRRSYLDRTSGSLSTVSPMLEQTIKYLSRIRNSTTLEDSLNYAIDAGFLSKDYFCDEQQDFILDPSTVPTPAESSWLAPGAVLSGCQHATTITSTITTAGTGTSTTLYRFRNNDSMTSTLFDPANRPWLSHSYSSPRSRTSQTPGPEVVTSHAPQQDRWPVKVTIHSVDYERMSLSATMEAYNVPSHPHQHQSLLGGSGDGTSQAFTRTSSITTYLEGEILDFNTHTLLTESFKSSASNDATYWRKLPPFQMFTDEEMVQNLTSRRWFNDVLSKDWILMRWKERCFVKSLNRSTADPVQPPGSTTTTSSFSAPAVSNLHNDSFHSSAHENSHPGSGSAHYWGAGGGDAEQGSFDDSGCGLTISGFYYVCLRRSDGKLEGLYYDPQSSPYQCLKLDSVRGGVFPAWGFR